MPSPLLSLALAGAEASYTAPTYQAPEGAQRLRRVVKVNVQGEKLSPAASNSEAPIVQEKSEKSVIRKINSAEFLASLRNAGKRQKDGKPLPVDPILRRQDEKLAIEAYVGYDVRGAHGVQLDNATRRARFEESKGKQPAPYVVKTAAPSVAGFVAGLPNEQAKRIKDLVGREKLSLDTLQEQVKSAKNKSLPISMRRASLAEAYLERERLNAIRQDIARLGG